MYLRVHFLERNSDLNAEYKNLKGSAEKVVAVLVNWRQPQRTIDAVYALEKQTLPPVVVVVDNGSGDDSIAILKAALPLTTILARSENGGFGAGCNTGIEHALSIGAEYIWLVNNDAVPNESCLESLLKRALSDKDIGVVGAHVHDPTGTVVKHAGSIMNPITFNCRYSESESEIAANRYSWITGASMLLTARAIKNIGLFDTGYFMYWEDADLCCRLRDAGFKLAVASNALVEHEAGTSSNQMRIKRYQWHLESQLRWVRANYSLPVYGLAAVYFRHIAKSILTSDWDRLRMTASVLKSGAA